MKSLITATVLSALCLCSVPTWAGSTAASSDLQISAAHARATVPGQTSGAAYLDIKNTGKLADQLVRVSTPVAKRAELHIMQMDKDMMKMREVESINIEPGGTVAMHAGDGYHLMLIDLNKPLKTGDTITLTLEFKRAGKLTVTTKVEPN